MSAKQQGENPADNAEPDDGVGDVVEVSRVLAHAIRYRRRWYCRRRRFSLRHVPNLPDTVSSFVDGELFGPRCVCA